MTKRIGDLILYTVPELEELLQVKARTIRDYLRSGRLQGRKFGKEWHVTEQQLKAFFEAGEDPQDKE